jgi:ketosteroid isomerase-like protein
MNTPDLYHQLAMSIFNCINQRDFGELEKNVEENVAFDFPGASRIEGAKRVVLFLKALLRKYPTLIFSVSEILVDGRKACVVWMNEGKSYDGKPYQNRGITLLYFEKDKIRFISDYFKDTSFVKPA